MGRRLDLMLRAGIAERIAQTREAVHQTGVAGTVQLFMLCLTLFRGDVSSALASAGAYEFHNEVMEKLREKVQFRLEHESSMIITQIEIMATRDSGPDRRNGQEPR